MNNCVVSAIHCNCFTEYLISSSLKTANIFFTFDIIDITERFFERLRCQFHLNQSKQLKSNVWNDDKFCMHENLNQAITLLTSNSKISLLPYFLPIIVL